MSYYGSQSTLGFVPHKADQMQIVSLRSEITTNKTIASTSFIDTGLTVTLANVSGGFAIVHAVLYCNTSTSGDRIITEFDIGGSATIGSRLRCGSTVKRALNMTAITETDGDICKIRGKNFAAAEDVVILGTDVEERSHMQVIQYMPL